MIRSKHKYSENPCDHDKSLILECFQNDLSIPSKRRLQEQVSHCFSCMLFFREKSDELDKYKMYKIMLDPSYIEEISS